MSEEKDDRPMRHKLQYANNREDYNTAVERGLRQIPNLEAVAQAIRAGQVLLNGAIVDVDTGCT